MCEKSQLQTKADQSFISVWRNFGPISFGESPGGLLGNTWLRLYCISLGRSKNVLFVLSFSEVAFGSDHCLASLPSCAWASDHGLMTRLDILLQDILVESRFKGSDSYGKLPRPCRSGALPHYDTATTMFYCCYEVFLLWCVTLPESSTFNTTVHKTLFQTSCYVRIGLQWVLPCSSPIETTF